MNLTIGPVISQTPLMPLPAVGALLGLLALSGGYVLRKRSRA
jgi:LPXTG-motif cell wall-anchored protein